MTTQSIRNSINRSPWRCGFLLIPLALASFALSPTVQAADGGLANGNTAEGKQVLLSLTTGVSNTAMGFQALKFLTSGNQNTANGFQALLNNNGDFNTATGFQALQSNTTGVENTAYGWHALLGNGTGSANTAIGVAALQGAGNGGGNTVVGDSALGNTTTASNNTAIGLNALISNSTGNSNIALGVGAGQNLTAGDNNIYIGNDGVAAEAATIRIGTQGLQTATFIAGISGATLPNGVAVVIDTTTGQLGIGATSSARFKDQIKPMNKASEAILALKPVTFHYKKEIDPKRTAQFGLVAEEVEKVSPDLVTRDAKGEVYTVRYEAVNAMLLNEFLKEHSTVQELKSTVAKQEATIAQQQKEIKTLSASLKEQASQIQKVSDQLEVLKPAPQLVVSNQ